MGDILEIKNITVAEAKEIINTQLKDKKDLSLAEGKIKDFFNKTTTPSVEKVRVQAKELDSLGLPFELVVQLLDMQPQDTDDLRLAFSKQLVDYDSSMQTKILKVFRA
ncbi:MAG: hypothetical protein COW47_02315 [Candidatus Huberarchaeum crystalense]|uniref:DNA-directed RNA polymerase subunit F n=1 Tax=Huberarchaeum crystalense TaxID=2014257 RepID=A0A2G9LJ35_HUBC1|nr:hypothetical protein [archaeon]OIP20388.1 MAG: hypothetical protein AUJ91_01390 [archaeon CG2_30_31_98]PIN66568.1 MAG: hypothetical protein COW69_01555 [Candidatus Huberarchaeum crystalense]NCS98519.1 hypothetical protein [archaeon]PIV13610.1 MAG: hypothetical protein COS45_01995 [Candidatus Huberarchaeum crystalense]